MQYKMQGKIIIANSYQKYIYFTCTWFNTRSYNQSSYHHVVTLSCREQRTCQVLFCAFPIRKGCSQQILQCSAQFNLPQAVGYTQTE